MAKPSISRREAVRRLGLLLGAACVVPEAMQGEAHSAKPSDTASAGGDLLALVNPMQGTNSNFGFSRGNTLPFVARPFGMTYWSMQNDVKDGWYFDPNKHLIQGIRATRQPSPWIGDYGKFTILPQSGETPVYAPEQRMASYEPADLQVHPHYLSLRLKGSNTGGGPQIELTPTERCAYCRFTFLAPGASRVIIDANSQVAVDLAARTVTGFSRHKAGGATSNFACYFVAVFDAPFVSAQVLAESKPVEGATFEGKEAGVSVEFRDTAIVGMRVGTSFISLEQARANLEREIGSRGFDAVREEAARNWNETLGIVQIDGGTDAQRRTFYSCLYRAHLFPRMLHEPDADGKPIHYSPYDGKVHPGVLYGDTGLWDGYRALYPLLSLIQPARFGEMIEGFTNAYREGGWLPQWPSPGTRGGMGGTHSDAIIADAILKDIPGFDRETAYEAARKDAITVPGMYVFEGRQQLKEYMDAGFRPNSVSNSLDYAYDDGCIALAAQALGKTDDYALLTKRAQNYRRLYNPETGFMQAKNADGTWKTPFDPYAWGDAYTEGAAWQWTWAVPHDPAGLIELMGGQKPFLHKLDQMLLQPSTFHPGGYGGVIHEMKEMAAFSFGQYDQGNQPTHQVLALFAAAGCPWKSAYWMRRVMNLCYSPDNFPGDEDNGEMASWYILNALGFYPLCVGHPSYVIGSPLFREARIHLSSGKTLTLRAPHTSPENVYVNGVRVNGKSHTALTLAHNDLVSGATVEFDMGAFPKERTISPADLPFAFSPYPAIAANTADSRQTAVRIDCGGDGAGEFVGDCFFTGGTVVKADANTDFAADSTPETAAIFRTAREGAFVYRIPLPMLPGNRPYKVRLHLIAPDAKPSVAINGRFYMSKPFAQSPPVNTWTIDANVVRPQVDGAIVIEPASPAGGANASFRLYSIEIEST